LTAIDKDGQPTSTQRDSYRVWLTLVDLRSNKIVAKARARAQLETVDLTPTPHFRDAPAWAEDRASEAYINTCHKGKIGDPIPPEYLDRMLAAALTSDAIEAYDAGRYQEALDLYMSARSLPGGGQLRVYNGIYLANRKLGRHPAAAEAFGDIVDYGLQTGHLAVKFLFKPGSTAFWPDPEVSGPYDLWLQQIAMGLMHSPACLEVIGHTSRTGPEPLNDRLSLLRAEYIKQRLQLEAPALGSRMIANGVGSRETIVGTETDDAIDALDRRVEFKMPAC
jgi:outer membrane protein OmpA-like peptidoglycan-associated protein